MMLRFCPLLLSDTSQTAYQSMWIDSLEFRFKVKPS